ncbi:MAG: hypothetical protein ACYDH1_18175 [Anaerolineaceae bacterium]
MGKVFKNITSFSLWLAMLVIIAHQFIPHDHHLGHISPEKGEACSTTHGGESENTSKLPLHCHAFNNLTFAKNTAPVAPNIHVIAYYFIDVKVYHSITPDFVFINRFFPDFQEPLIKLDFLKLSSLRAPPAIV